MESSESLQREYYKRTHKEYDSVHSVSEESPGELARSVLCAILEMEGLGTLLNVGAGTGQLELFLRDRLPGVQCTSLEPVPEFCEVMREKGLPPDRIHQGSALELPFPDNHFDCVTAFGVLHHVKDHGRVVREMVRVAERVVFIRDSNCFGQGGRKQRWVKRALRTFRLWGLFNFIRTKGKMYHYSEGDGIFYSYSLFDDMKILEDASDRVHLVTNGKCDGHNLLYGCPSLAVVAYKK